MASLLRQWMADPALYQQARVEARQTAQERAPHLFDPDLLRRLSRSIGGGEVPVLDTGEDVAGFPATLPVKRARKPSLMRRIRLALKAGLTITAIQPDDTLVIGKPGDVEADANEWDEPEALH
jgi:hypothetical protein